MSIASFGRNTAKLKALWGIRARLVLLALILVLPLMLDRVRLLEDTRTKQVAQAANELSELAKHTADAQREIVSTVQAVLKSSAYIFAAASHEGRGCAIMRASLRVDLPWIRSLSIVGPDGKIGCSTAPSIVGFDLGDRDYVLKAREFSRIRIERLHSEPHHRHSDHHGRLPGLGRGWRPGIRGDRGDRSEMMSQLLINRGERSGVSVVLVDSKGTILATPPDSANLIGASVEGHVTARSRDAARDQSRSRVRFDLFRVRGRREEGRFVRPRHRHARAHDRQHQSVGLAGRGQSRHPDGLRAACHRRTAHAARCVVRGRASHHPAHPHDDGHWQTGSAGANFQRERRAPHCRASSFRSPRPSMRWRCNCPNASVRWPRPTTG